MKTFISTILCSLFVAALLTISDTEPFWFYILSVFGSVGLWFLIDFIRSLFRKL